MKMRVSKKMVLQSMKIVEKKKELWESILGIHFDKYGRKLIKDKSDSIEGVYSYFNYKYVSLSETFIRAFNLYLETNNLEYCSFNGYVKQIKSGEDISLHHLDGNYFPLAKEKETCYSFFKKNASRVLAAVNVIWLSIVPEYQATCDRLKVLRKENNKGKEFEELLAKKLLLEENNLYFDYQKIMNMQNKDGFYISINPLDFLTCSRGYANDDNPTKFETCTGLKVKKMKRNISFEKDKGYSDPVGTYLIGQILNAGLVFQKNGNELKVPNTNFSLYGYTSRGKCWLDTKGLWIEKSYPCSYDLDSFADENIKIITEEDINFDGKHDFSHLFGIQDTKAIANYCNNAFEPIYLDRVAIDNNKQLIYLPELRKTYNEDNEGDYVPYDCCSDCDKAISGKRNIDYYKIDDELYCKDCYDDCVCSECGEFTTDIYELDDSKLCPKCLKKLAVLCADCGQYVLKKTMATINNEHYCEYCAEDVGFKCHHCEKWFPKENKVKVSHFYYCTECAHEAGFTCDHCSKLQEKESSTDVIIDGKEKKICLHCYHHFQMCYGCAGFKFYLKKEITVHKGRPLCPTCLSQATT